MKLKKTEEFRQQDREVIHEVKKLIEFNQAQDVDIFNGADGLSQQLKRLGNRHIDDQDIVILEPEIKKVKKNDPLYKKTKNKELYLKFWMLQKLEALPEKMETKDVDMSSSLVRFLCRRFT